MEHVSARTEGERIDDAIGPSASGECFPKGRDARRNRPRTMASTADCGLPHGVWMARLGRHRQAVQEARRTDAPRHLSSVARRPAFRSRSLSGEPRLSAGRSRRRRFGGGDGACRRADRRPATNRRQRRARKAFRKGGIRKTTRPPKSRSGDDAGGDAPASPHRRKRHLVQTINPTSVIGANFRASAIEFMQGLAG